MVLKNGVTESSIALFAFLPIICFEKMKTPSSFELAVTAQNIIDVLKITSRPNTISRALYTFLDSGGQISGSIKEITSSADLVLMQAIKDNNDEAFIWAAFLHFQYWTSFGYPAASVEEFELKIAPKLAGFGKRIEKSWNQVLSPLLSGIIQGEDVQLPAEFQSHAVYQLFSMMQKLLKVENKLIHINSSKTKIIKNMKGLGLLRL